METATPPEQQVKPKTSAQQETPANKQAIEAGKAAMVKKVENLDAAGTPEPVRKKPEPPTRRTLRQAVDAMDKEILKLVKDRDEKRKLLASLQLDVATTEKTIAAISRIREEFE